MKALRYAVTGVALVAGLTALSGCGTRGRGTVPPGTLQPDQFLFDRGNVELQEGNWLTAREYFRQVTDTYTQSPLRPDAALAVGDTYLGEAPSSRSFWLLRSFRSSWLSTRPTRAPTTRSTSWA